MVRWKGLLYHVTRLTILPGEFPGPTLEARSGDQLVVVVSNQLEDNEGVSIHWHGLHMKGKTTRATTPFKPF
jgi:FtsP/CotA-like multicopper oxidase with cupredoxin domain